MPKPLNFSEPGRRWKGMKSFPVSSLCEPDSVVANEICRFAFDCNRSELDNPLLMGGSVLPGIAQEIIQDHPQQHGITFHRYSFGYSDNDPAAGSGQFKISGHLFSERYVN